MIRLGDIRLNGLGSGRGSSVYTTSSGSGTPRTPGRGTSSYGAPATPKPELTPEQIALRDKQEKELREYQAQQLKANEDYLKQLEAQLQEEKNKKEAASKVMATPFYKTTSGKFAILGTLAALIAGTVVIVNNNDESK